MTPGPGPAADQTATLSFTVTAADTAIALGSGDVPVLGTPRLIAWCEAATVAALARGLEGGQTSVGYRITIEHLAPTPVGATVDVTATVNSVDGRQVTFSVTAFDAPSVEGTGPVLTGTIVRVVVDHERFVGRLRG